MSSNYLFIYLFIFVFTLFIIDGALGNQLFEIDFCCPPYLLQSTCANKTPKHRDMERATTFHLAEEEM